MATEGRKEPSIDPVKAQGILAEVSRISKYAAEEWPRKWGFYCKLRDIQEKEAEKIGMSPAEFQAALASLSSHHAPKLYPGIVVDSSPMPLPPTSSGMIGRRTSCPLEKYGRLVRTARDFPLHPPRPPGSVYDPYKQTLFFLGSVEGDPISYKLPPASQDVTDEMWARPQQLSVSPFHEVFEREFKLNSKTSEPYFYEEDKSKRQSRTSMKRNETANRPHNTDVSGAKQ